MVSPVDLGTMGLTVCLGLQAWDQACGFLATPPRPPSAGRQALDVCSSHPRGPGKGPAPAPHGAPEGGAHVHTVPLSVADPVLWNMALQRAVLLAGLLVEVASKSSENVVGDLSQGGMGARKFPVPRCSPRGASPFDRQGSPLPWPQRHGQCPLLG